MILKRVSILILFFLGLNACGMHLQSELYEDQFILVEDFSGSKVRIAGQVFAIEEVDKALLTDIQNHFKSRKYLAGRLTDFSWNDLYQLDLLLSQSQGELFYLSQGMGILPYVGEIVAPTSN